MRLEEKLRRARDASRGRLPEEAARVMSEHTARLESENRSGRALGAGHRAPEFALPAITGEEWRLSERRRGGPVVLTFYRGRW